MDTVIALDGFDDIFSDFDIRSYDERAISRDFLDELRLRARKAGGEGLDIVLLTPADQRDAGAEELIAGRLRVFFEERRAHSQAEDRSAKRRSLSFVATGLVLTIGANYLVESLDFFPLFRDFLLIPAWFFVWNGLDLFFKARRELVGKKEYYRALAAARISFRDREDYGEAAVPPSPRYDEADESAAD